MVIYSISLAAVKTVLPSIVSWTRKEGENPRGLEVCNVGKLGVTALEYFLDQSIYWLGSLSGPVMCATLSRIFRTEFTSEKLNGVYVFVVSLCELTFAELQSTEFYARK